MTERENVPEVDAAELIKNLKNNLEQKKCTLPEITKTLAEKCISANGFNLLEEMVRILRDRNFETRAEALRQYVELPHSAAEAHSEERLAQSASHLVKQASSRETLSTPSMAAVFTAHPTFALDPQIYDLLSQKAEQPALAIGHYSTHRRAHPPTLNEENRLATTAITRGRDALDKLNYHIIRESEKKWGDSSDFNPAPIILSSWVGFDTDGRNDIHWHDTFRIRLELKIAQLTRLYSALSQISLTDSALGQKVEKALKATKAQLSYCPKNTDGQPAEPVDVALFAQQLITFEKETILTTSELSSLFEQARQGLSKKDKLSLDVIRSGFVAHGLGLSHIHTRLNAAQIYNIARTRLGLTDDPTSPAHRRILLSRIDQAMDELEPLSVNFGSLLIEPSAAARLMMTMRQILKHIDSDTPIRFLIAETESGYTLLATLWLARLFGIKDEQIEISPLFETESALENGETILREAMRSKHWRDYIRANGKLSLQFGYSDSGRYVGQLTAGTLVENLRLKAISILKEHDLENVSLIMFDTHGESIGRGAHPFSFRERLTYFSPPRTYKALEKAHLPCRFETAFQGGDGYTLFGTETLAQATISIMAEQVARHYNPEDEIKLHDPLYDYPNFPLDFFTTIAVKMGDLVNDPGYTALLSAFGPSLIDKTGSRPSARQSDTARVTRITHPSQIRAIPNNAILQQLGWWANILHGLGTAANRNQEVFTLLRTESPRFKQLMDFASQALSHSDIEILRETVLFLDPGTWLDRAEESKNEDDRARFLHIAQGLEELEFWKRVPALFRRIHREHIDLTTAWPDAPQMATEEKLLHAIRFALIEHIWRLSTDIPYFGPRGSLTREAIANLILCLDVPRALRLLEELFPITAPKIADLNFGETGNAAIAQGFVREHEQLFRPLQKSFDLLREIGIAIMHANHAFG
ncbi:phosphoenolpyruvate carboxylase [Aristophania vespae]|uniref:Phosphoenolpyruvate carboxylase n=1 Tax=Aristophania vespae TaxID=2697033 RepID=A0A6P1NAL7_9PROT|nr:phosphoenolpyruvate carboxylase [Aristophania vespae]QHI95705.1 phosphoenolpyruvate carboxylase [Aristophania vespae]UMM63398.1 Phosphoenolpyruvate carboxylase [Aristophania vespae]